MTRTITPWSVKGIDDQTRDVARGKAKEAGINIGTWINKAILEYNGQQNSSADYKAGKTNILSDLNSPTNSSTVTKISDKLLENEKTLNQELRPLMFAVNDLALRLVAAESLQKKETKKLNNNLNFQTQMTSSFEKNTEEEVKLFTANLGALAEGFNNQNLEQLTPMTSSDELSVDNYDINLQSSHIKPDELVEEFSDNNLERPVPIAPLDEFNTDLVDNEEVLAKHSASVDQSRALDPSSYREEKTLHGKKKNSQARWWLAFVAIIIIFVFGGVGTYFFPAESKKIMKTVSTTSNLHLDSISRTLLDGAEYLEKMLVLRLLKTLGLVNDPDVSEKNINSDYGKLNSSLEKNTLVLNSQHITIPFVKNKKNTYSDNREDKLIRSIGSKKNYLTEAKKYKQLSQISSKSILTSSTTKLLKDRANSGEAYAQYKLGMLFIKKKTSQLDYSQAAHWLKIAAVQGLTEAQYNLGVLYERGLGVPKDESQALLWFHSAAKKHHSMAQFNLGNLFLLGKGTQKNYPEAVHWFKLASNNGLAEAAHNFSILSKVAKVEDLDKLERSKLYETTFPVQLIGLSTSIKPQKHDKRPLIIERSVLQTKEEIMRTLLPTDKVIIEIQAKLSEDGFYIGSIDGLFGPNIESAIRVYELEQGLPVSGLPSKALLQYMQRE
jgi:hypothetical protein